MHQTRPRPRNKTITLQDDSNQHAKGWRFVVPSPWVECTSVGAGKDTHGTLGSVRGKAVGARQHVTTNDTTSDDSTTRTYTP